MALATIPTNPNALSVYPGRKPSPARVKRYAFAGAGVGCVGLAGVGVVVPGMPTTVFLIAASWCFARSCPWLTDKLIHNRFFRPFAQYLVPGTVMPVRAKVISLAMMWAAVAASTVLIASRGAPWFVPVSVVAMGLVATWFIVRQGHKARKAAQGCPVVVLHGAAHEFVDASQHRPARTSAPRAEQSVA